MWIEQGKVSIIVPVYNADKYLNRCLNSIASQSYPNLQIILVDDGSVDLSGKMCDQWAEKDLRVEVVHKENQGPGSARNTGVEKATGEFCMFVDSDDSIETNAVELLLDKIRQENADVCYGGCANIKSNGDRQENMPPLKLTYEGDEILTMFLARAVACSPDSTEQCFAGVSACAVLYRTELIKTHNILFKKEKEILTDDIFFNIELCKKTKKIAIVPQSVYNYFENAGSLTRCYRKDRFEALKRMKEELEKVLLPGLSSQQKELFRERIDRNYMNMLIVCLKQEVISESVRGRKECMTHIREIVMDEQTVQILQRYPICKMPIKQRILFSAIKGRCLTAIFWLFWLRYRD